MSRRTRVLLRTIVGSALVAVSLVIFACDTAGEFEDCKVGEESTPGTARCPRSLFPADDARADEYALGGIVWRGEVRVSGAVVRMEPNDQAPSTPTFLPAMAITNESGTYKLREAPIGYDLWVHAGDDLVVHRGLLGRFYDPPLAEIGTIPGFDTNVAVRLVSPVAEGHTLTFLVGEGGLRLSGDEQGLVVTTRTFTGELQINAIEHPKGETVAFATRLAQSKIRVVSGQPALVDLVLQPVVDPFEVTFDLEAPPGFVPDVVEASLDFGVQYSRAVLGRVRAGEPLRVPRLPCAFGYRARAASDSEVSESGYQSFSESTAPIEVKLAPPATLASPSVGVEVGPGDELSATGTGVLEHLFEPIDGGALPFRVVTMGGAFPLPDLSAIGVPRPTGRYRWRVRGFPKVKAVGNFYGANFRPSQPTTTTAPREIVLR